MATPGQGNGAFLPLDRCDGCRNDHRDPLVPVQVTPRNAEDIQVWEIVRGFYDAGFVELVTRTRPFVAKWDATLRKWTKQPAPRPREGDFGYRINFADMQRMHMRMLQAKLISYAMADRFDDDHGVERGVIELLGSTLHDYGAIIKQ